MDHESLKDKVFELYDGELPAFEKPEVERHLASCAECRGLLERWKASAPVLFPRAQAAPSEAFVQRVMAWIEEDHANRLRPADVFARIRAAFTVRRLALAAAAAVIVFMVAPAKKRPTPGQAGDPAVYVAEVLESPYPENGDSALGTSVEEYFLYI